MVHVINEGPTETESNVIDVFAENFMEAVFEKSKTIPVVVDFWAPWCGPCKTLTPILEELANEYAGAFRLAKVNIDEQQALAAQASVRSVPTVFLFKNGEVVDGFMGAQPKNLVEQFLSKHVTRADQPPADPTSELVDQDQISQAMDELEGDDSDDGLLRLAQLQLRQKLYAETRSTLEKLEDTTNKPEYKSMVAALDFIELANDCESEHELRALIDREPNNWGAHYKLAAIHLAAGNPELALESLLLIVRHDRSFDDDAGRRGLIKAFDMLGQNHPLVPKYRSLLARTLN